MVGIDIGKTELFVCLDGDEQKAAKPCANTAAGHQNLLTWLHKRGAAPQKTQVVMESTSVYWEVLAFTLHDAGFKVSVVNPAKIKFFARSLLRRGKTDTLDAALIAQYGATMRPACWTPPEADVLELRALVRDRDVIVALITLEKSRRHAADHQAPPSATTQLWSDARLALLEQQVKAADQAISVATSGARALRAPFHRGFEPSD
nr:transposase [Deinococcus sp. Arct2-2]